MYNVINFNIGNDSRTIIASEVDSIYDYGLTPQFYVRSQGLLETFL